MKKLLITTISAFVISGCAGQVPYIKVGAGYKIDETKEAYHYKERTIYHDELATNKIGFVEGNKDPSARLEVGLEDGGWSYGISHHSNWLQGKPFDSAGEYQKTEFFIDYTYRFAPLK